MRYNLRINPNENPSNFIVYSIATKMSTDEFYNSVSSIIAQAKSNTSTNTLSAEIEKLLKETFDDMSLVDCSFHIDV